ncbi:response regulator [Desulfococcus sp.]|uniref:response regulator n=1 Tax=Desulfococcus sp. TaxID=2025834 RepID=UPI0035947FED
MKDEPDLILLIEDNPDHAEMVMRLVRRTHAAAVIEHVSDGEAALDYLFRRGSYAVRARYPLPRLILLDLRLPRIDGLEVLKSIKTSEALCRIPVVVLTTSEAESDIAGASRLHANSYLVKPMDLDVFASLIETMGNYWLLWNRR